MNTKWTCCDGNVLHLEAKYLLTFTDNKRKPEETLSPKNFVNLQSAQIISTYRLWNTILTLHNQTSIDMYLYAPLLRNVYQTPIQIGGRPHPAAKQGVFVFSFSHLHVHPPRSVPCHNHNVATTSSVCPAVAALHRPLVVLTLPLRLFSGLGQLHDVHPNNAKELWRCRRSKQRNHPS